LFSFSDRDAQIYGRSPDPDYAGHFLLEVQIAPLSSAVRSALSDAGPAVVPAGCRAAVALLTEAPIADDTTVKRIVDLLRGGAPNPRSAR
jgi:hypothetical protein